MKLTCIGAGNVAWRLLIAMDKAGHKIEQVISKSEESAKALASKFGAFYGTDLSKIYDLGDLVLIAVPDDQIKAVIEALPPISAVLAHTCGSRGIEVLESKALHIGVFYPLQTLNKDIPVDIREVPLLLESSDIQSKITLDNLARSISDKVQNVTSEERAKYQLAAVVANNFANHLFSLSADFLEKENLDFNMLIPLIEETGNKLKSALPSDAQTGPAQRGDLDTLSKHRGMLEDSPELLKWYNAFSSSILKKHHKDDTSSDE